MNVLYPILYFYTEPIPTIYYVLDYRMCYDLLLLASALLPLWTVPILLISTFKTHLRVYFAHCLPWSALQGPWHFIRTASEHFRHPALRCSCLCVCLDFLYIVSAQRSGSMSLIFWKHDFYYFVSSTVLVPTKDV